MSVAVKKLVVRLLPVILLTLAIAAWFNDVQEGGPHVLRNLLPPLFVTATDQEDSCYCNGSLLQRIKTNKPCGCVPRILLLQRTLEDLVTATDCCYWAAAVDFAAPVDFATVTDSPVISLR